MPTLKVLALFAILGLIVWGVLKSNPTEFLKVDIHWDIDQQLPIPQAQLENQIKPLITDKYQLDLQDIKYALELEPWVQSAHIKRLFWNAINIKITSHNVAMRWENIDCDNANPNTCKGYISTGGVLFMPQKFITSDVVLAVSKQDKTLAEKMHQDYQTYQKLSKSMTIKSFFRTNIDQLEFASGVKVILGYQKQNERLSRFVKTYQKLKKKTSKVKRATFDMRYPKGFTLSY